MVELGPQSADRGTGPPGLGTCWEGNADTYGAFRGQKRMMLTHRPLLRPPCPSSDLPWAAVFKCSGRSGQRIRPGWTEKGL